MEDEVEEEEVVVFEVGNVTADETEEEEEGTDDLESFDEAQGFDESVGMVIF